MKTNNPWVTYTVTIDFTAPNDATARLQTLAITKVVTAPGFPNDINVYGPEPQPIIIIKTNQKEK